MKIPPSFYLEKTVFAFEKGFIAVF